MTLWPLTAEGCTSDGRHLVKATIDCNDEQWRQLSTGTAATDGRRCSRQPSAKATVAMDGMCTVDWSVDGRWAVQGWYIILRYGLDTYHSRERGANITYRQSQNNDVD